jgi:hypothetical protein
LVNDTLPGGTCCPMAPLAMFKIRVFSTGNMM